MPKIEGLITAGARVGCAERFWFGPRFKHSTVFPDGVRSIKGVILILGTFEKVKLYKARDFFEMTVARHPDLFERCFGPFGNAETVHCDEHVLFCCSYDLGLPHFSVKNLVKWQVK
jgi:hypothetical protein